MVWFQCEDCGENLKKPKLAGHFRICSAFKLSCIDCGDVFDQQSVQGHTQCISEAEKYGPKGQGKLLQNGQAKPNKTKQYPEVDVNVGLSSRPPWFCSLCNTQTTSKQSLLLHSDGKKHRAKARAFHAVQEQANQTEEPSLKENGMANGTPNGESVEANDSQKTEQLKEKYQTLKGTATTIVEGEKEHLSKRKRDFDASVEIKTGKNLETYGEVRQASAEEKQCKQKKKKSTDPTMHSEDLNGLNGQLDQNNEASKHKIKWKKLLKSTLKMNSDGEMKIKMLQKLVIKALREFGVTEDKAQLQQMLMNKINSSSHFIIDGKLIRLLDKTKHS